MNAMINVSIISLFFIFFDISLDVGLHRRQNIFQRPKFLKFNKGLSAFEVLLNDNSTSSFQLVSAFAPSLNNLN